MAQFVEDQWFQVQRCGKCGVAFAMTTDLYNRRLDDRLPFWCPNGHERHFTGPSEKERLKTKLERKEQMLVAERARAANSEASLGRVSKAHRKMRERVMNGVCPCCNRSFPNLRAHMSTQHPDFASSKTLYALRTAFGMTQADVAREVGIDGTYVSMYERDKHVPERAKARLDDWLERHNAPAAEESS